MSSPPPELHRASPSPACRSERSSRSFGEPQHDHRADLGPWPEHQRVSWARADRDHAAGRPERMPSAARCKTRRKPGLARPCPARLRRRAASFRSRSAGLRARRPATPAGAARPHSRRPDPRGSPRRACRSIGWRESRRRTQGNRNPRHQPSLAPGGRARRRGGAAAAGRVGQWGLCGHVGPGARPHGRASEPAASAVDTRYSVSAPRPRIGRRRRRPRARNHPQRQPRPIRAGGGSSGLGSVSANDLPGAGTGRPCR